MPLSRQAGPDGTASGKLGSLMTTGLIKGIRWTTAVPMTKDMPHLRMPERAVWTDSLSLSPDSVLNVKRRVADLERTLAR